MTPGFVNGSPQGFHASDARILSFSEWKGSSLWHSGMEYHWRSQGPQKAGAVVTTPRESECDLTKALRVSEIASRARPLIVGKVLCLGTGSGSETAGIEGEGSGAPPNRRGDR
jgi:hypothetical protein